MITDKDKKEFEDGMSILTQKKLESAQKEQELNELLIETLYKQEKLIIKLLSECKCKEDIIKYSTELSKQNNILFTIQYRQNEILLSLLNENIVETEETNEINNVMQKLKEVLQESDNVNKEMKDVYNTLLGIVDKTIGRDTEEA